MLPTGVLQEWQLRPMWQLREDAVEEFECYLCTAIWKRTAGI